MGRNILKLSAVLICAPAILSAQSTFGTILGTVTDRTGAVIPNVKITVINQEENISREATGDTLGNYEVANLKAGTYSVLVEASGFKSYRQTDLTLDARHTLRVNVTLEIGQVNDQVTVEGSAAVVTTETETIANAFTSQEVLSLPANFRGAGSTSPLRLLAFLPGVQSDNSNNFSLQGEVDRKSTRLNSSHVSISYAVFCLKKKKTLSTHGTRPDTHAIARSRLPT